MDTPEKLQKLIAARGYPKQVEFARRLGITEVMLSRWLSGTSRPSDIEYVRLARELGVTVDYLLDPAKDDPSEGLSEEDRVILVTARQLGFTAAMARLLMAGKPDHAEKADRPQKAAFIQTSGQAEPPKTAKRKKG